MKFSKWIMGAALLFTAQVASVQGQGACEPCDPCYDNSSCDLCDFDFCELKYDFYVDALYWKLNRSGLHFGDDTCLNHDWEWGYRIGAVARYHKWDLGLRWTAIETNDSDDEDEDFGEHKLRYQVLDLEAGHTCCLPNCGLSFRPLAGVKFAWIKDKFEGDIAEEFEDNDIDFWGVGLYLGCSARWDICKYTMCEREIPIAFVTRASTGIIHGSFDNDFEDDDHCDEHQFVLYNDLYVGLDLSFCDIYCGYNAFFQVGYEIQHWGSWKDWSEDHHEGSWGLGGLVLRFGLDF